MVLSANRLAESTITVVPSRNEGFGLIILEAMNQGDIVVSFKGNAGPETLIRSGYNGYLADYQGEYCATVSKPRSIIFPCSEGGAEITFEISSAKSSKF